MYIHIYIYICERFQIGVFGLGPGFRPWRREDEFIFGESSPVGDLWDVWLLGCLLAGCLDFNSLGFHGFYNLGTKSLTFTS